MRQETKPSYSRSDIINEAIEKHMKELGIIENDDDEEMQS